MVSTYGRYDMTWLGLAFYWPELTALYCIMNMAAVYRPHLTLLLLVYL